MKRKSCWNNHKSSIIGLSFADSDTVPCLLSAHIDGIVVITKIGSGEPVFSSTACSRGTSHFATSTLSDTAFVVNIHSDEIISVKKESCARTGLLQSTHFHARAFVITALQCNDSGTRFIIGCEDGSVLLFSAYTSRCVCLFSGFSDRITDIAWGTFLDTIAVGCSNGLIKLYPGDVRETDITKNSEEEDTGTDIAQCPPSMTLEGHESTVSKCRFGINGSWILCSLSDDNVCILWDVVAGTELCRIALFACSANLSFAGSHVCVGNSKTGIPYLLSLASHSFLTPSVDLWGEGKSQDSEQ